jgi:hypothetical protein
MKSIIAIGVLGSATLFRVVAAEPEWGPSRDGWTDGSGR